MAHWFHRNPLKATAPVSFNFYGVAGSPAANKICKYVLSTLNKLRTLLSDCTVTVTMIADSDFCLSWWCSLAVNGLWHATVVLSFDHTRLFTLQDGSVCFFVCGWNHSEYRDYQSIFRTSIKCGLFDTFSDLRTTRARLLEMFTDITCNHEIMKNATDAYFSLLQGMISLQQMCTPKSVHLSVFFGF